MKNTTVLISGASIAGPALAYWLARHGFTPTVVEKAPALRPGGQAVDVRGVAVEVARRMGILDGIRRADTRMRGMSFVDAAGEVLFQSTEETLTGGVIDSEDIEILRDDLAGLLYDATRADTEYVFGDSITAIEQGPEGTRVTFEKGATRTFDLVVGADGLHSNVRGLAFGPESTFIRHLDTYLSVFSVDNFLGLDHWQVFHQGPGMMVGVYAVREDTEARAVMGFESPQFDYDHRDVERQKQVVADYFTDGGWEIPQLLKRMWEAPDFHFDSMSQIRMDTWSAGRVTLIGDAGYSGSPLSGQGTTMALVGAYVLAGELKAAAGDHVAGFAGYEARLRGFADLNQQFALDSRQAREAGTEPPNIASVANAMTLLDY